MPHVIHQRRPFVLVGCVLALVAAVQVCARCRRART